jgi:hypothetical protein
VEWGETGPDGSWNEASFGPFESGWELTVWCGSADGDVIRIEQVVP